MPTASCSCRETKSEETLSDLFCICVQKLLGSHEPSSVQLWVSYNRQPMKAAQFMTRHPITVSVFSCIQKCFTQQICLWESKGTVLSDGLKSVSSYKAHSEYWGLRKLANVSFPNVQFFKWPLEADAKSETLDCHVKIPNLSQEANMFTAW